MKAAVAHATFLVRLEQAGPLERVHVFHDRGQRHGERPGQIAHGRLTQGQSGQDRAPGRVGEGRERGVEARQIVNHVV